ncbi:MAG: hypothetical protein HY298_15610 [Verrucomicrobia bacterium]|nr:hypothetical protein [Verrucomicrobiota bacterium]
MFEHRKSKLLPRRAFYARLARSVAIGLIVIAISLSIGMLGYHHFENFSWVDSFVNAAMILSGMGPSTPLQTNAGKVFAGFYALFSGIVFITTAGLMLAPVVHRFLHKFHLESEARDKEAKNSK